MHSANASDTDGRMDIKARSTENPASVPPVAKYLDMVRLWVLGYGKALGTWIW